MADLSVGSVQAAVLLGRGAYLHASAVLCRSDEAIIIAGGSGSGKSTLANLMHQSGLPAVADDTVAVFLNSSDETVVQPAIGDCLWPRRFRPLPVGGIVFVEKGGHFTSCRIGSRYAYYRLLRDGGLWSDVYRLYEDRSEYVQSRGSLRRIVGETPCVLLSYSRGDPGSSRRVVEYMGNVF